jgi:hypothetical protein
MESEVDRLLAITDVRDGRKVTMWYYIYRGVCGPTL